MINQKHIFILLLGTLLFHAHATFVIVLTVSRQSLRPASRPFLPLMYVSSPAGPRESVFKNDVIITSARSIATAYFPIKFVRDRLTDDSL